MRKWRTRSSVWFQTDFQPDAKDIYGLSSMLVAPLLSSSLVKGRILACKLLLQVHLQEEKTMVG